MTPDQRIRLQDIADTLAAAELLLTGLASIWEEDGGLAAEGKAVFHVKQLSGEAYPRLRAVMSE